MKLYAAMFALGALAACSVSADYGGTRYRCNDGKCPAGFSCVANFCEAAIPVDGGPDAAPPDGMTANDGSPLTDGRLPIDGAVPLDGAVAIDGSVGPDGAVAPPCGQVGLLRDDFNDGVRSPDWDSFVDAPAVVSETGGRLVLTLAVNTANAYLGYTSWRLYDLIANRISVEVPVVPSAAGHGQAIVVATNPANDSVQFLYEHGSLYFQRRVSGTYTDIGQIPYDASLHRFWAMSESGGNLRWETSPDGNAWTVRASAPAPIPLKLVEIAIMAGTYSAEAAPGAVQFDNLDGTAATGGKFCKATSLTDDFADGVQAPTWSRSYSIGGATRLETGGQLALTPSPSSQSQTGYKSATAYDLTGDSAAVEVPQMLNSGQAYAEFELSAGSGSRYVEFFVQAGQLEIIQATGGASVTKAMMTYSPTEHRWWRFREATGMLFFETSSDGRSWVSRFSELDPFALSALDIYLLATTDTVVAAPGSVHYDNYNLLP